MQGQAPAAPSACVRPAASQLNWHRLHAVTGDLISKFFELSCKTETLMPPLSGFFPPAMELQAGECLGERPLTSTTVCRDNFGLLEAVTQGLDAESITTRNECALLRFLL